MKRLAPLVVACMAVLCGPAVASAQAPRAVAIGSFFYKPSYLRVNPGDTVVWRNGAGILHTVTSATGAPDQFDSGDIDTGGTFARTFTKPGRYPYLCTLHPDLMHGVIQVGPDRVKPRVSRLSAVASARKLRLRLRLSEDARIAFTVARGRKRVASFRTDRVFQQGDIRYGYTLAGSRVLKPGRYVASAVGTDVAGNRGRAATVSFRVR